MIHGSSNPSSRHVDVIVSPIGSVSAPMNESVMIGLAATSHGTAAATTAAFDDLAIAQPQSAQPLLHVVRLTSRRGPR